VFIQIAYYLAPINDYYIEIQLSGGLKKKEAIMSDSPLLKGTSKNLFFNLNT
jgi:hypothetical protein